MACYPGQIGNVRWNLNLGPRLPDPVPWAMLLARTPTHFSYGSDCGVLLSFNRLVMFLQKYDLEQVTGDLGFCLSPHGLQKAALYEKCQPCRDPVQVPSLSKCVGWARHSSLLGFDFLICSVVMIFALLTSKGWMLWARNEGSEAWWKEH